MHGMQLSCFLNFTADKNESRFPETLTQIIGLNHNGIDQKKITLQLDGDKAERA